METDGKFSAKRLFELLSDSVCEYTEKETRFSLEETELKGKAELEITAAFPGFVIRNLDKKIHIQSIPFCNQSKEQELRHCADHALFLFNPGNENWTLDIFEFKTSLGVKTWDGVIKQFNGAMVRAYAIADVLRIAEFESVCLHCAYRNNKSSPAEERTFPGKPAPKDFLKGPITLRSYPKLTPQNAPIKLDENGYAEIKL